jgi:MoaA/NifB/PqqE/SkfB family radical SAM enzyme
MCPRYVYEFDNENMDLDLYRKIIEDCRDHVEFVWPYGVGEPLIHPRIFEMIRITRKAGIRAGLSTNATLLDDTRADQLLDSGLDYLILAFDGATRRTYETYRVGASFEQSRRNIVDFLRKKQARHSPMHVVVQMVVLKENRDEIESFRKLWTMPGLDEVRFKRDEVQLEGSRIPGDAFRARRRNPCYLLWRGPMYVSYDGRAHPCCQMYDQPPVGDLKTQSVSEVWNSTGMVRLREAHLAGDLEDYPRCTTCQAARPSLPAFYGSLAFSSLRVRKVVPALEKLARFYNLGVFET